MAYKRQPSVKWISGIAVFLFILSLAIYFFSFRPPGDFPGNATVIIPSGESVTRISQILEDKHIIRSPFWFTNFVIMLRNEKGIVGGTYYFEKPLSVAEVAKRLALGDYNVEQRKTTIPEGSTIFDISQIIKKNYPDFDNIHFLTLSRGKEGYLFPDTYLFGANPTPERVITMMNDTFNKKIKNEEIQAALKKTGRSLEDVVIMASILEGEARKTETRRIVAGILWKRLEIGMALQVDSSFRYVNGKTSEELTMNDLKIDSAYNTYVYRGLPPGPISNPGLDSIMAALTPIKTDYMFFLTDKHGTMHYAETLDEHVDNKVNYLN
jgi:UPF0755 protein